MKHTQIRIAPDLLARIEEFRQQQLVKPSLSETIRALIERGLETIEPQKRTG